MKQVGVRSMVSHVHWFHNQSVYALALQIRQDVPLLLQVVLGLPEQEMETSAIENVIAPLHDIGEYIRTGEKTDKTNVGGQMGPGYGRSAESTNTLYGLDPAVPNKIPNGLAN
jgi:hypothetical protein